MLLPRTNVTTRLFDEIWNHPFFSDTFSMNSSSFMKTDIKEQGDSYMLEVELPGFDKQDIQAKLENGYLTIEASKNENHDHKDDNGPYVRRERYAGSCKRMFYVGEQTKQEDIKANFDNGVLKLTLPKAAPTALEEKDRSIPIE